MLLDRVNFVLFQTELLYMVIKLETARRELLTQQNYSDL